MKLNLCLMKKEKLEPDDCDMHGILWKRGGRRGKKYVRKIKLFNKNLIF